MRLKLRRIRSTSTSSATERSSSSGEGTYQRLADASSRVQRQEDLQRMADASSQDVHRIARAGVSGSGSTLPHFGVIQRSFGRHDVSHVRAYTGPEAARASRAIGASAYATGSKVAFAGAPSLHTAAHEAAHVVQQRAGVSLQGGVGHSGDAYERHADAVADRVVQGQSAEALLDRFASAGGDGAAVQSTAVQRTPVVSEITDDEEAAIVKYKGDQYKYFNMYLRGQQVGSSKVRAIGQTDVPNLQSALAKMAQHDKYLFTGTLYRGDVFSHYPEVDQELMDTAEANVEIRSFFSTSKLESVADTYGQDQWEIESNINGVDIHGAGIGQAAEGEVLFPHGSRFKMKTPRRKIGFPKVFGGTRKRKINATQSG